MSVTTNQPRGLNLPRPKPPIVPVTQENVRDWWALLVNRKAYTRQSANTHPDTGRHYHYQPKNKDSGQPLELDPSTIRKHLAGWITIGLSTPSTLNRNVVNGSPLTLIMTTPSSTLASSRASWNSMAFPLPWRCPAAAGISGSSASSRSWQNNAGSTSTM